MRTQATDSLAQWPAELTPPSGVLVLTGYGLSVRVWRGRLRVEDGVGHDRREAIIHRATGRLRRLVVLGHTGSVTLDAIRWLADVGAGYLQLDADGQVIAAFGPQGTDRPGLRRAQARALDTEVGDDIARRLLAEKVAAQAETLVAVNRIVPVADVAIESLRSAAAALHVAVGRDDLRVAEARAAAAYWSAWSGVSVTFARRDAGLVPAHWLTVGTRGSLLAAGPRLAVNPANAILNYVYAILEGEASIAARLVGLDPGLGVMHADQLNRDSLAADLMEPIRPLVDRFVLGLFTDRYVAAADFYETRQGVCRITPALARDLAATSPVWARAVGRVAEDVARLLDDGGRGGPAIPTPLTGRNRSLGRGKHGRPDRPPPSASVGRGCISCGRRTTAGRETCSEECAGEARALGVEAFVSAGRRALVQLRATGWKPVHGEEARARIGERTSELVRRARAWQRANPWPTDPGQFAHEVLPELGTVPVAALVAATGLSEAYCRRIKRGEVVPHPMWWESIEATVAGK